MHLKHDTRRMTFMRRQDFLRFVWVIGLSVACVLSTLTPLASPCAAIVEGVWSSTSAEGASGETAIVINTTSHHGAYSAQFTSNGDSSFEYAYVYRTLSPSLGEFYARGYFYVDQSGIVDNNDRFYFMRMSGSSNVAYAGWRKTNGVIKWTLTVRNRSGYATTYSIASPSINRWYYVELHWKKDSTEGLGELWVDGRLVCSVSGKDTALFGETTKMCFGLAEAKDCSGTTVNVDCVGIGAKYIGPEPASAGFEDSFESGSFAAWNGTVGTGIVGSLVEQIDSKYRVRTDRTTMYYSEANAAIDAGLSSLGTVRTENQIITLRGSFQLVREIMLLSYITVDMYGATLDARRNYRSTFDASDANSIILQGGIINGNKRIKHGINFYNVNDFIIQDLKVSWTWSHSVYLDSCKSGLVKNVEASHAEMYDSYGVPVGASGFVVRGTSDNITFDSVYVHDIWMERYPRPKYDMWGGGIETMIYPSQEPRNIKVVNSRFRHLGEFGIGTSTNGLGLHTYNHEYTNNTFEDIGKEAIDACYLVDSRISKNTIAHTERYGILVYAADSTSSNIEISDNKIFDAGFLTSVSVGGIATSGNGVMNQLKVLSNTLRCNVGLRLTPRATNVFVDGNDFNTCGTAVLTWTTSVTWGTNIDQYGQIVTGKKP